MLATANTGEIGRVLEKNAGEWTGRVEISKEEIPGSKRSIYCYMLRIFNVRTDVKACGCLRGCTDTRKTVCTES